MVQLASCSSPSTSGPSSCEQRSSIANSVPAQLTTAISRSSHSTTRMAPGGSSVTGQMSMISGNEVQIRLSQEGLYRAARRGRVRLVSGALTRLAAMHRSVMRVLRGIRMTLGAQTAAHAELRSRITGVVVLTVVLDLVAAVVAWMLEHDHGEIT